METILVVLEKDLLQAVNRAAKRVGWNRSALVREALRKYLADIRMRELDAQERAGYERFPQDPEEFALWDRAAVWPDE